MGFASRKLIPNYSVLVKEILTFVRPCNRDRHGFLSGLMILRFIPPLLVAALASCTAAPPAAIPVETPAGRPLDTLPAEANLDLVRHDLVATASDRFGGSAVEQALAAPAFLIAKRFAGMAPPPPPGAGPDWVVPTPAAVLIRGPAGWMVASANGWRPANREAAAEIGQLVADPGLWSEPAYTPPCPDFGASLLLLKIPGHSETVRNSTCTSRASRIVEAALRA